MYYYIVIESVIKHFGRPRARPGCKDNIKTDKRKTRWKDVKWILLVQRLVNKEFEIQFL
jgi:hypothetical protein